MTTIEEARDVMRHVPPLEFILERLDVEYRRRARILLEESLEATPSIDATVASRISAEFSSLCKSLDRLAEIGSQSRTHANGSSGQVTERMEKAFDHAVQSLRTVDPNHYRRRESIHSFEKSIGESVYAAFLVVVDRIKRITSDVATLNPNIHARLLDHVLVPHRPLNDETRNPIA